MPSNYVDNYGIVTAATSTVTIAADAYLGSRVIMRAAATTFTLPAATGSGNRYEFIQKPDATGSQIIKVANATDVMVGVATIGTEGIAALTFYAGATGDTITLNGTTTGGLHGARVICDDIASGFWGVLVNSRGSGTIATPFSATVS